MACILNEIKKIIQKDEAEREKILIVKTPTGGNFFYDFWKNYKDKGGSQWEKK
jgi:hypothetical protein